MDTLNYNSVICPEKCITVAKFSQIQIFSLNYFSINFFSMADDDHILRKLLPKGIWYLTVLGSLATTQREYVALHAFCRLNSQVAAGSLFCMSKTYLF